MRRSLKAAGWLVAIAAVSVLIAAIIVARTGKPPPIPYGAFLDQLEAGNVVSVAFEGMEIEGVLKRPAEAFTSNVPEVGDPTLVPSLRKQHVAIDVKLASPWTWIVARIPWPMLLFVGAMLVAGFVRMLHGGKPQAGTAESALPTRGMMGLVSTLLTRKQLGGEPPPDGSDEPKGR